MQIRTDRIVFKLFGKDPSDLPIVLRKQILDWLSSSPTDIESYIRPGCVVLTIYVCMDKNNWQELYFNLNSSLRRFVDSSNDLFWRTGWIYTQVRHHATFLYNGQVVLDSPLPVNIHQCCKITSVTPIAVSLSEDVRFVVKGFNLSCSTSRLLCALEGKYLVHESCADVIDESDSVIEHEETQCFSFSCVIPNFAGRGFIEVEDHGLSSTFFPFIVAEKDTCSEIRNLESVIARDNALDFIHEMGWLLHKSRLRFRLGAKSDDVDQFPLKRFRWLIEFAIGRDWCAVLNKLLSAVFDGDVCVGPHTSVLGALLDIGILHQAVRRKRRPVVRFLLEYRPSEGHDEGCYLFRPDTVGPGGLTPLHVAASMDGCDDVLDELTDDPGSVGIEAWKNIRDNMGFTPYDYACMRGRYSYIHLVRRKANKNKSGTEQVVVDIPDGSAIKKKIRIATNYATKAEKLAALEMEKNVCMQCDRKLSYGQCGSRSSVVIYRPAMVSMVAIAAICVCAALLFKSLPEVLPFKPFSWELLKYGSQ
ncbi:squamosa promoter-binding-like protein 1 [Phtheirospermum japonicum]|uniref:Squamosa promoter-binding-like protein 1 n=1 Tax=Phtheirospermum japonicum TaxID=374723 RepID=A0A830BB54_9LAMI|nr:squamosa promoter-binding-like protein 1 [Phtheirospermum japonicum]